MVDTILSVSIKGQGKARKQNVIAFAGTVTLAQLQGWATDYLPKLDAVENGVIESASVTLGLTLPGGLKTSPTDEAQRVNQAALLAFTNSTRYVHDVYVPGMPMAAFTPDGSLDLEFAGVGAMLDDYTTGVDVSGTTIKPTNGSGEALIALDHGKFTYLK